MSRKTIKSNEIKKNVLNSKIICVLLAVLFIVVCSKMGEEDSMGIRPSNRLWDIYNPTSNESVNFTDIMRDIGTDDKSMDKHAKLLRSQGIEFSGKLKVQEINYDVNTKKYCITSVSYMRLMSITDNKPNQIVLYMKSDPTQNKILRDIETGDTIKFKAKFNGINKDYIILNEGELIE